MKIFKFGWKIIKKLLLGMVIFLGFYFGIALILSLCFVAANPKMAQTQDFEIYIVSSGVHAEFVVPFKSDFIDWSEYLDVNDYDLKGRKPQFVSFGWGEEKFLLETPTWGDLTAYNFCNALFRNTSSLMQARFWTGIPKEGDRVRKINISAAQYQLLVTYIMNSFERDKMGKFKLLPNPGYGPKDRFYKAVGHYNLIQTCNVWITDGLKKMGLKTAIWSPWDFGIFYHLKG